MLRWITSILLVVGLLLPPARGTLAEATPPTPPAPTPIEDACCECCLLADGCPQVPSRSTSPAPRECPCAPPRPTSPARSTLVLDQALVAARPRLTSRAAPRDAEPLRPASLATSTRVPPREYPAQQSFSRAQARALLGVRTI